MRNEFTDDQLDALFSDSKRLLGNLRNVKNGFNMPKDVATKLDLLKQELQRWDLKGNW